MKIEHSENAESRKKLFERFDWPDTLITETEKQEVENILFEHFDIFARNRMDLVTNTEFKVKLTPKDNKAVYSRNLPTRIHLKEDLLVELVLMHKYGILTVLHFSKYAGHLFAQKSPNGKLCLLLDLREINSLIADDYPNNNQQSALCQTQQSTWQGSFSSASLTVPRFIIVCRWQTNSQKKCLHSVLLAELLPARDLLEVSADLCRPFYASCASN